MVISAFKTITIFVENMGYINFGDEMKTYNSGMTIVLTIIFQFLIKISVIYKREPGPRST